MRRLMSRVKRFMGKDIVVLTECATVVAICAVGLSFIWLPGREASEACYKIAGGILGLCILYAIISFLAELGDDRLPYGFLPMGIFASAGFFAAPIGLGLIGTAILLPIGVCLTKSFREYEFTELSLRKWLAPLFGEFLIIFVTIAVLIH